jgi:predicted dehydrogenase
MKKDIGIGIIGTGMGIDLVCLNSDYSSRMEVRGLCALPLEKVKDMAAKLDIGFATDDHKKLIGREDIDVVAVFSPDHLHAEHIIDALNAGKHVLVTKPMVTSLESALKIMEVSEKNNLKFAVGETCRFYTSFLSIKKMLDDGDLGDVVFSEAHYIHDLREIIPLTPWRVEIPQDFMYGGVCHPLDSLVWFMGQVDEVQAFGVNSNVIKGYPIEDTYLINLKFKNGRIARVLGAYGIVKQPYPMMGLTIYGTRGTATADFTDFEPSSAKVVLDKIEGKPVMEMDFTADLTGVYGQGDAVVRYLKDFESALVNGTKPEIDAREGVKTIAALSAAWESIRSGGKTVKVYDKF